MTTVDNNDECGSVWSREQDKAFENALATHTEESSERWEKITVLVPGKSMDEIKHHYELLVEDINGIECGRVPLPCYPCSSEGLGSVDPAGEGTGSSKKTGLLGNVQGDSNPAGKVSRADQERRKGIAWTEEEHRLFLLGLDKYGKGDWRSISRNFVVSRTPTQVASHAQKYFIRLNSMNRDRRRSSIHDITSVGNGDAPSPQGPMTGQSNGLTATKHSGHPPAVSNSGVGVYGNGTTTIGQPVAGPMVCAVGTPVNLPAAPPHMAYGMRPPLPGTVVPGAPMSYTLPHSSGHR